MCIYMAPKWKMGFRCRNNVTDALEKMQECLDKAAESVIPAKEDPEKSKEMAKR